MKIKRKIYAPSHKAIVDFPAGFRDICMEELKRVLASAVYPGKYTPKVKSSLDYIYVSSIDFRTLLELPQRLLCARQIWWILQISEVSTISALIKAVSKVAFDLIFPIKAKISLRVDSYRSQLFHEKKISLCVAQIITQKGYQVVDLNESDFTLRVLLKNDRMYFSCSLAKKPLYQRGYRKTFTTCAPIAEHIANCLIEWSFVFARKRCGESELIPSKVWVPFAGSGTLGFETISAIFRIPTFIWGREYGFEKMICYPQNSISDFRKKIINRLSLELKIPVSLNVTMIDNSKKQILEINDNINTFMAGLSDLKGVFEPRFEICRNDFFNICPESITSSNIKDIFIPLNPPYGSRLAIKKTNQYLKIGAFLHRLSKTSSFRVFGICLLPDEQNWRSFIGQLKLFHFSTIHFTHGGKDMRAVAFLGGKLEQ